MSGLDPVVMNSLAWLRTVAPAVFAQRRDLQLDSRKVKPGDVFLALPGAAVDGRGFIDVAVRQGAAAVIVEANGWKKKSAAVPVLPVPHLRSLLHSSPPASTASRALACSP